MALDHRDMRWNTLLGAYYGAVGAFPIAISIAWLAAQKYSTRAAVGTAALSAGGVVLVFCLVFRRMFVRVTNGDLIVQNPIGRETCKLADWDGHVFERYALPGLSVPVVVVTPERGNPRLLRIMGMSTDRAEQLLARERDDAPRASGSDD